MTRAHRSLAVVLLWTGAAAACTSRVNLETMPLGSPVEVTREDGGVVRGTLTARNDRDVHVAVGPATRLIPRDQIASVELADGAAPPPLPAAARFREYLVPAGTALAVRLATPVGSDTSHVNDAVEATLTRAVLVDGVEVLPAGSIVMGVVTTAQPSGRVRGRAGLAVRFRSISLVDRDETYALSAGLSHTAASTRGDDVKKIGIPAAGGAAVGAIVGGKKGAGIGAIIGGGAATAVVLATAGREIRLPRGADLSVSLDQPVDVRVPIKR